MNPNEHLVKPASQLQELVDSGKSQGEALRVLDSQSNFKTVDLIKIVQMVWNLHSPEAAQVVAREVINHRKTRD